MNYRASALSVGALLFVVVLGHVTLFPKIADVDGFYHVGHAFAYAEGSMFDTSMPWATQSVIGDRGADLWWGFHVALMPFTVFIDVVWSIRVAGLVLTLTLAGTFFWVLGRHEIPGAGWWTTVYLIAVPSVFLRHLMVVPDIMALAASLLLLSMIVRGRWRYVFVLSALVTWLQLGLFWVPPAIAMAYGLVRLAETILDVPRGKECVPARQVISATTLGTTIGWLLRPNPVDTGLLANFQILRFITRGLTDDSLFSNLDLLPAEFLPLLGESWLFVLAWMMVGVGALSYLGRDQMVDVPREERTLLLTTLLLSVAFLMLALVLARRATAQWVAFGFLAMPLFWTHVVHVYHRRGIRTLVNVLLAAHVLWGGFLHAQNLRMAAARHDTMLDAAAYLEGQSEPGEVVFHVRPDNFGPLFAHNRTNLYLGGLDPIFQFVHEPRFYWEHFYLSADLEVDRTCDAFPCASGRVTDTHEVLQQHFGARWVVVEPARNPRLSQYLRADVRFELAFETETEAVFEVLRVSPPPFGDVLEPVPAPVDTTTVPATAIG